MRIAFVSDIHGNLHALQAVMSHMEGQNINYIFSLGDVIGYGAYPKQCLKILQNDARVKLMITGNHEQQLAEYYLKNKPGLDNLAPAFNEYARKSLLFCQRELTVSEMRDFGTWPKTYVLGKGSLSIAHGSFAKESATDYVQSREDCFEELQAVTTRVCVVGHTHIPCLYRKKRGMYERFLDRQELSVNDVFLVNPGSVGQPRDRDKRASYVIFELLGGSMIVELHRVDYDVDKAADAIRQEGLPEFLAWRLKEAR